MTGQSAQRYLDFLLDEMASAQHGVVAWFQLKAANVPRDAVDQRLKRGSLHRLHRGVYAVGHRALSLEGRRMAAVLALGPRSMLCNRTAAEHLGLLRLGRSPKIHVAVSARSTRKRRSGLVIHQLPDAECVIQDGIPTTSVPWTLLGLAAAGQQRALEQAIDTAERSGVFDLAKLRPFLASRRPGAGALRTAVAQYDDASTNGELERRFLVLCREHGLPRPHVNTWIEGYLVDFHWRAHRLIVETDGKFHDGTSGRRSDGARDAALALAGWRTQRVSWWQVDHEPEQTAALIRRLLDDQQRTLSAFSGHIA
jgi:very-short-patch-repair endonuclease